MAQSGRILVTGATGLLGATLVPALRTAGLEVFTHGRSSRADFSADLTAESAARSLLESTRPNVVINLVALTDVDRCEREPHEAYLGNVRPLERIVRSLPRGTTLIHVSTDQLYDGPGPHREEDIRLVNTYALTKYCAELVAAQVGGTVLRTNFYGLSRCPGRPSFSDWLTGAFTRQEPLKLFTDVLFSPLSLTTLVEMMLLVLADPKPGQFNLGCRDGLSKRDFAHEIAHHLALSTACARNVTSDATAPLRAPRPRDMRMDVSLFERTYGVTLPRVQDEIRTGKHAQ